jgi:hypothetical protein
MFQQLPLPFCDVESFKGSNNSKIRFGWVWFMVFNATFNNISIISWRSVLLVEENTDTRSSRQKLVLHYDGSKPYVSLFLTKWAKKNKVILLSCLYVYLISCSLLILSWPSWSWSYGSWIYNFLWFFYTFSTWIRGGPSTKILRTDISIYITTTNDGNINFFLRFRCLLD